MFAYIRINAFESLNKESQSPDRNVIVFETDFINILSNVENYVQLLTLSRLVCG